MSALSPFHEPANNGMTRTLKRFALPLLMAGAVVLGACGGGATSGAQAAPGGPAPQRVRRSNPNVLTQEEIEANRNQAQNLYDLVQRLRPRWLLARTVTNSATAGVVVFFNEQRMGGVDVLRSLPLSSVESLRYLDATAARGELPLANGIMVDGAIVVRTRPTS